MLGNIESWFKGSERLIFIYRSRIRVESRFSIIHMNNLWNNHIKNGMHVDTLY